MWKKYYKIKKRLLNYYLNRGNVSLTSQNQKFLFFLLSGFKVGDLQQIRVLSHNISFAGRFSEMWMTPA